MEHGNRIEPAHASTARVAFSFVVDAHPRFAYSAYHLARSLIEHCRVAPESIHVHVTPAVTPAVHGIFGDLGCSLHPIVPFGDQRHCNKLAQLATFQHSTAFDQLVLLDTDMIAVEDIVPHLAFDGVQAKTVDMPVPSLRALQEIGANAGLDFAMCSVLSCDAAVGDTLAGNCNGGFYCLPRALINVLEEAWTRWALWLLAHPEPLQRERCEVHVDQVAMLLALTEKEIPWVPAPSNLNYYIHFAGAHRYEDPSRPVCVLHYHDTISAVGLLTPHSLLSPAAAVAVEKANKQIARGFDNRLFWDLRYVAQPELGSGLGSRQDPLRYKRSLLASEGLTSAESVLDVGCGDMEVLRPFELHHYLGLDLSEQALVSARRARPDLTFQILTAELIDVAAADFVLCFEVLIHQPSRHDYDRLIGFLARHTRSKLLVSGYDAGDEAIAANHMTYFYEPLPVSLTRTGRFRSVEEIGAHTTVKIYRCIV